MEVFTMVKNIDYPRDSETHDITAAIHPQLQVQLEDKAWPQFLMENYSLCWIKQSDILSI